MAHVALYREWRPLTFDEVVEQTHVVTALRHAVATGQIAHAYLFSGTRGTGKTTVAKIFSRAINCLKPENGNPCNQCEICSGILNGSLLDVVEMDAASNNSVDTIRRIVDEVVFMPTQARYKVYIVDEVHMLSTGAFNALLKTLEEPPAHAVFILATTEPHRIPATILSRCQRYEFRRIPLSALVGRLREIADVDGIAAEPDALEAIARLAEGGMRDAISLLDQVRMTVMPGRPVSRDDVLRMTGVADDELMARVSRAILTGSAHDLLDGVSQLVMSGRDPARFLIDLAAYCRNLLVAAVTADPSDLLQVTNEQLERLQSIARLTDSQTLVSLVRELSALHGELRWSSDSRTTLEVGLLRLMSTQSASRAGTSAPSGDEAGTGRAVPHPSVATAPASSEAAPFEAVTSEAAHSKAVAPAGKPAQAPTASATPVVLGSVRIEPDDGYDSPLPEPPPEVMASMPPDSMPMPVVPVASVASVAPVVPVAMPAQTPVAAPQPIAAPTAMPAAHPAAPSVAEPAGAPFGKPADTPFAKPVPAVAEPGDAARWKAIQDQLVNDGQMTLYLFSRPAAFAFCGGELHLIFSEKDQVNCQEMREPQNIKALRSAATSILGTDTPVVVRLAADPEAEARHCPVPQEPGWITRVRKAADTFGIPMKMEED